MCILLVFVGVAQATSSPEGVPPAEDRDRIGAVRDWASDPDGIVDDGNVTLPCLHEGTCHRADEVVRRACPLGTEIWTDGGKTEPCVEFRNVVDDAVQWHAYDDGGRAQSDTAFLDVRSLATGAEPAAPTRLPGEGDPTPRPGVHGSSDGRIPIHEPSSELAPGLVLASILGAAAAVPLWILYRRLDREEIVDHEVRSRLIDLVEQEPGIETSELSRRLDLSINTVLYHGRLLAEADAAILERIDGRVAFFPAAGRVQRKEAIAALRQGRRANLFDLVLSEPGINVTEAAGALDVSPDALRYHVDVLVDREVLESRRDGRQRKLFATPTGRDLWTVVSGGAT